MKYGILPCPKCIALAACKTRDVIDCVLLKDYFLTGIKDWDDSIADDKIMRRLLRIESFFGREITTYGNIMEGPNVSFAIRWSSRKTKKENR